MLLGVDVGGTFTDAVIALDGRLLTAKAPTTPSDQSQGVIAAVEAVLAKAGARAGDVGAFAHAMTVATNALLEGRAARTALIVTEGFTDVIELARQNRAELYRLCAARPAPLVPAALRFGAPERMTPDGPLRALSRDSAQALASDVIGHDVEAVAVVLLHAYRHPDHEQALGEALAEADPGLHVSLSHEVVGTFREYERAATTEIDAALSPLLAGYLRRLADRAAQAGLPTPAIMQSNGGLIDLEAAAGHAAWTVLSGPAAGAAGAAFVARAAGEPHVLCLDMGGTSCDVCVVSDGSVDERPGGEVAGRPLALPMLAVHTVGAGGGSIAWRDGGGALRVGPRSAGAEPGPACYGRGGKEPTVTDANLLLGYLSPEAPLAGGVALDRDAAQAAIGRLADELGLAARECAAGIVRVAGVEMARALRAVTVARGVDPRDFALLAFGGAGPLHATQIADELGMARVLCAQAAGVLSALGLVVSPWRRDAQRSVLLHGDALSAPRVGEAVRELGAQARAGLGDQQAPLRAVYELRYRGQSFELAVQGELEPEIDALRAAFDERHEERYGYRDAEAELELVTVRVSAIARAPEVQLSAGDTRGEPARARRRAVFDDAEVELEVLRGLPEPGTELRGPGVLELPDTTVVVSPGWAAAVHDTGTIALQRMESASAGSGGGAP
jgi:N-methylhydantoinase A